MAVENGFPDEETTERKHNILIGLQIDEDGRDLLSWTLTNLAEEDDRLIAVSISRNQDLIKSPTPTLIQFLDDCFSQHEHLCTRKKIILAGRVCRGSSIKKALVKEAELLPTKTVVVGSNKNYSFGRSASLANYCAKKLPPTIALFAIHKGKVVLQREAAGGGKQHPGVAMEDKDDRYITEESNTKSSLTSLMRKLPEPRPTGWPLLRRAVAANVEASKEAEARKMSVVQWAMNLPDRSLVAVQLQVNLLKELEIILGINSSSCKFFNYEELMVSTNYFSPENLIGKGGNSQVYKGCLPDANQVAIKLSKLSQETTKEFLLEVDIITRLRHEYVVDLIGVCVEEGNLISVYSYFSNGTLEDNLRGKLLDWDTRFKVAVGVAEALSYIHDGCSRHVVHRDVKSSNILLSNEYDPQLSDFGLAVWAPTSLPYLTHGNVVGTFGYLAPEYFMYGKLSTKVDVYAFGVVLLELLTGRKPINGKESLVMWGKPILERGGDVKDLLDPNLEGKFVEDEMQRMASAARLCITRAARLRPQMSQILSLLRGEEEDMVGPWRSSITEVDCFDEEALASSIGSHLGLALLDVDDELQTELIGLVD